MDIRLTIIPYYLEEISTDGTFIIGFLLLVSVILIALTQRLNYGAIGSLTQLILTKSDDTSIQKTDFRIISPDSVLMLVNFIITIIICISLSLTVYNGFYNINHLFQATLITTAFLIHQIGSLWFAGLISGEQNIVRPPIIQTILAYEWVGVLLFFIALVWFLNPNLGHLFFPIFLVLIGLIQIHRIIRAIIIVFKSGVALYYIILYFCTLEILPLVAVYYYTRENFMV